MVNMSLTSFILLAFIASFMVPMSAFAIPGEERCGNVFEGHSCVKELSMCIKGTHKNESKLCFGKSCCLPENTKVKRSTGLPTPGTISALKCQEYSKYVFKEMEVFPGNTTSKRNMCGWYSPLITGGYDAHEREFPHMAHIGFPVNGTIQWKCGGSLISEQYILSAAHCSQPELFNRVRAKWALLGDLILNSDEDANATRPVVAKIVEHHLHPLYNPNHVYHDIVLFRLDKPLTLSPFVRPICLHTSAIALRRTCIATGWGINNIESQTTADHLQKAYLDFIDYSICMETYKPSERNPFGINTTTQICAGDAVQDTCKGDSGGPLQIKLDQPLGVSEHPQEPVVT